MLDDDTDIHPLFDGAPKTTEFRHILNCFATIPLSCRTDMATTEPDLGERHTIDEMPHAKLPAGKIAEEIERHRWAVYREIERNNFENKDLPYPSGYSCVTARRPTDERRTWRHPIRLENLRAHVIDRLEEGRTPERIAGHLGYDDRPVRVSHETIYAFIHRKEGHLPSRLKKRGPRYARRPGARYFHRTGLSIRVPTTRRRGTNLAIGRAIRRYSNALPSG